jgi:hypothetical protein
MTSITGRAIRWARIARTMPSDSERTLRTITYVPTMCLTAAAWKSDDAVNLISHLADGWPAPAS